MNKPQDDNDEVTTLCGAEEIKAVIAELDSRNKDARLKARKSLVSIGEPATGCLVEALASPKAHVRYEASRIIDEINVDWSRHADAATVRALAADLGSKDSVVRVRARQALANIGGKAVAPLVKALKSKDQWQRWEAAKALGQIGDPEATDALINALEDEEFDVRWLAAEGLVNTGQPAVVPLLHKIIKKPDSLWLREGLHHVLHGINLAGLEKILIPVRNALEDSEAPLAVPFAVDNALKSLTTGKKGQLKSVSQSK